MEVKKILFPLDLSEASPKIVPWVRSVVEKYDAELHVLFVARIFEQYLGMGVPVTYVKDMEKSLFEQSEKLLADFIENHLKGLRCLAKVLPGYPSETILDYAFDSKIDLIVLGTHGRKGLDRIIFGSVAEYVVKHSRVPVLTVNPYRRD